MLFIFSLEAFTCHTIGWVLLHDAGLFKSIYVSLTPLLRIKQTHTSQPSRSEGLDNIHLHSSHCSPDVRYSVVVKISLLMRDRLAIYSEYTKAKARSNGFLAENDELLGKKINDEANRSDSRQQYQTEACSCKSEPEV